MFIKQMAQRINLRNYLVTHLKVGSNLKADTIIAGGLDSFSTFTDFEENSPLVEFLQL